MMVDDNYYWYEQMPGETHLLMVQVRESHATRLSSTAHTHAHVYACTSVFRAVVPSLLAQCPSVCCAFWGVPPCLHTLLLTFALRMPSADGAVGRRPLHGNRVRASGARNFVVLQIGFHGETKAFHEVDFWPASKRRDRYATYIRCCTPEYFIIIPEKEPSNTSDASILPLPALRVYSVYSCVCAVPALACVLMLLCLLHTLLPGNSIVLETSEPPVKVLVW